MNSKKRIQYPLTYAQVRRSKGNCRERGNVAEVSDFTLEIEMAVADLNMET